MIVESIQLDHFRNYERLELNLDPGTNVFYGNNAQGKTNILESVYLCGTTRSHRMAKDREMIRFGEEESHLRMKFRKRDVPYRIDMHLKRSHSKGIAINGVPIRKAGELIGLGYFVFFSPEDLNIIKNGPADRRRFMDMLLCQQSASYIRNLSSYQKVLMQRNKLLKEIPFRPDLADTLDTWDEQMVRYGSAVIFERQQFIEKLAQTAGKIHSSLTGGKETLRILYEKNTSVNNFAMQLRENRNRDLKLKMTMTGPHRDDLSFRNETIDLRRYGSQGQQRTTALSMKLAEIELIRENSHDTPVLLLDDVLSELDRERQHLLLERISNIQTLITCTDVADFTENQFQIDRMFHVIDGKIER